MTPPQILLLLSLLTLCNSQWQSNYPYAPRVRYRPNPFLEKHNECRFRAEKGVLKWDRTLEEAAINYAEKLAISCEFKHSSTLQEEQQGENLFWTNGKLKPYAIESVKAWCDQPLDNGSNHHTQIVGDSTHVGCASRVGPCGTTVVCRYAKASQ